MFLRHHSQHRQKVHSVTTRDSWRNIFLHMPKILTEKKKKAFHNVLIKVLHSAHYTNAMSP